METKYYSAERNVQILVSLLKQHGIKENHRFSGNNQHAIRGQCPI